MLTRASDNLNSPIRQPEVKTPVKTRRAILADLEPLLKSLEKIADDDKSSKVKKNSEYLVIYVHGLSKTVKRLSTKGKRGVFYRFLKDSRVYRIRCHLSAHRVVGQY